MLLIASALARELFMVSAQSLAGPAGPRALLVWTSALGLPLALAAALVELADWRKGVGRGSARAACTRAVVLATLAWLAVVFGAQQEFSTWRVELWLAWAAIAWCLSLLAEPWIRRIPSAPRQLASRVLLVLSATVVLAELALRSLGTLAPQPLLVRGDLAVSARIDANRFRPGGRFAGLALNSRGYNDVEFGPRRAGVRRAVAIGDSFSYSLVPHTHHFTAVAEQELQAVEILNLGIAGVGPVEYAELLVSEALPLDPDLVLVDLFVGNDFADVWKEPQSPPDLARSIFDARNVLLVQAPRRLARIRAENRRRARSLEATRGQMLTAATLEERLPWLDDPLLELPNHSEEAFLELERERARFLLREADAERYRALWSWIEWMRERARPVPLVVMLIPDEFQVEEGLQHDCLEPLRGAPEEVDKPQRWLKQMGAEQGILVLDLLPVLRAVAPLSDGKRHLFHLRDTHFNARGCRVVGSELARFVAPLLAPPASTATGTGQAMR